MLFSVFRHLIEQKNGVPTKITQLDDPDNGVTTLRVEGDMSIEDARLIERLGDDIRARTGNRISVDLADLYFLDSESAPFLRQLESRDGFKIEGIEIFLQKAIDQVERRD